MIDISNNSFITLFVSTILYLFPVPAFGWIIAFGNITVLQKGIVIILLLGVLALNFYLNFLIYYIYYNEESKEMVVKQLGRVVYKSKSLTFDIKSPGLYAMSIMNFVFLIDDRKFRFRGSHIQLDISDWLDRKKCCERVRSDIIKRISHSA